MNPQTYPPDVIEAALREHGGRWRTMARSLLDHGLSADECWPWQGHFDHKGYGRAYPDGRSGTATGAHRAAWELLNGQLPPEIHVDHRCHDYTQCQLRVECPHRKCVNPHHLAPATPLENSQRSGSPIAENGRRTHCSRNHEFNEKNTRYTANQRICRVCEAIRSRAARADRGAKPRPARRRIAIPSPNPQKEHHDDHRD